MIAFQIRRSHIRGLCALVVLCGATSARAQNTVTITTPANNGTTANNNLPLKQYWDCKGEVSWPLFGTQLTGSGSP